MMRRIHSLYAACLSWLLFCSVAGAELRPHDPIVLWGIQRDCQLDAGLSHAVQERLDGLGHPLFSIDTAAGLANGCVGTECLDLLHKACGVGQPAQGVLLGGHVAEQLSDGRYRARIRLFRVEFAPGTEPRMYLRYERLEKACPTQNSEACRQELPGLLATLAGQILEERSQTALSSGQIHTARPPYCSSNPEVAPFLCEPFPLRQSCLSQSGLAAPHCPFAAAPPRTEKPNAGGLDSSCDCKNPAVCSAKARDVCSRLQHSPVLRRALGGSLLAAGAAFLAAGLLITLNDARTITLRSDVACNPARASMLAEPCFAARGSGPTTWILGAGLTIGGAMILWDPLDVFRDRPQTAQPVEAPPTEQTPVSPTPASP